jgi:hypothetical protein
MSTTKRKRTFTLALPQRQKTSIPCSKTISNKISQWTKISASTSRKRGITSKPVFLKEIMAKKGENIISFVNDFLVSIFKIYLVD